MDYGAAHNAAASRFPSISGANLTLVRRSVNSAEGRLFVRRGGFRQDSRGPCDARASRRALCCRRRRRHLSADHMLCSTVTLWITQHTNPDYMTNAHYKNVCRGGKKRVYCVFPVCVCEWVPSANVFWDITPQETTLSPNEMYQYIYLTNCFWRAPDADLCRVSV